MIEQPTTVTPGAVIVPDERPRRRRRGAVALLLALTTVSLGAGMFSLAYFTDNTSTSGTFAAGTVDITTTPATTFFTATGMVPGDTVTQAVTVTNAGSATLRWSMSTVATNALGSALTLTVKTVGTSCAAFDGTSVLAATALNGAAIGSATQGAQAGDRTLAPGAENLCFRVSFPSTASDNPLQGGTSTATFTFNAEQTANNP